ILFVVGCWASWAVVTQYCPSRFLISDRDRDPQCNLHCSRSQSKPLCASDGRTYESMCDYQRAKCREPSLSVTHRGRCKGRLVFKCL
uniref:Kazal-like domain-containing protein n=1 Tax=Accipiter nisus TaxID=211598 RepID=A0A8B9RR74_9AVES